MKRILFAFCFLITFAVARTPAQNARIDAPQVTATATATAAAASVTPSQSPTSTATATATPTSVGTRTSTFTATANPVRTLAPVGTSGRSSIWGTMATVNDGPPVTFRILKKDDGALVEFALGSGVVFYRVAGYDPVHPPAAMRTLNMLAALRLAAQERAPVQLSVPNNAPQMDPGIYLTLSEASAATLNSLTPTATPGLALTPTPPGFAPTPTPVIAHQVVNLPWGVIDLDAPSDDQVNFWARIADSGVAHDSRHGAWFIPWDRLSLWATNPRDAILPGSSLVIFRVIGKGDRWVTDAPGQRYLPIVAQQVGLSEKPDLFYVYLYENAEIATNIPEDSRKETRGGVAYAPTSAHFNDINAIHIGRSYGAMGVDLLDVGTTAHPEAHAPIRIGQPYRYRLIIWAIEAYRDQGCPPSGCGWDKDHKPIFGYPGQ